MDGEDVTSDIAELEKEEVTREMIWAAQGRCDNHINNTPHQYDCTGL